MAITYKKGQKPSLDAQTLVNALLDMNPGDFVSYKDLTEFVGKDVQSGDGYRALFRARQILKREERKVFEPVPGEGIKCLEDHEIVGTGKKFIRGAYNRARKGSTHLACVDYESLPDERSKNEYNVSLSVMGTILEFSKASSQKKIEARVAQSHKVIDTDETVNIILELDIK